MEVVDLCGRQPRVAEMICNYLVRLHKRCYKWSEALATL